MCRKRNVSDGDSGFDSALSSRSSSISLDQESPEFGKQFFGPPSPLLSSQLHSSLRKQWKEVLTPEEDIEREDEDLLLITNRNTGVETLFKPPSRLKFSILPPQVANTYSSDEYDRNNTIPRSALFHARLEYELEKQIAKMDLVEVDLIMEAGVSPPPSLGIRVIGVNMIHGVSDKLNIYVKRIIDDSVAGSDGRILVNDHIVEVNGISLVGVSQKLAAQTLSNCAVCPETGTVHFVLARPSKDEVEVSEKKPGEKGDAAADATAAEAAAADAAAAVLSEAEDEAKKSLNPVTGSPLGEGSGCGAEKFPQAPDSFLKAQAEPEFQGRDAVRLTTPCVGERSGDESGVCWKVERLKAGLRASRASCGLGLALLILATMLALVRRG